MSVGLAEQAYESKVLDPEIHGRLVKEIESVARRANIPVQMVWTSMTKFCTDDEIAYVRELRRKNAVGILGLVYEGYLTKDSVPVIDRMSAAAAACVRNYINAQVMMVSEIIQHTQAGTMPNPTVLLIPNFYIGEDDSVPKWRSGVLLDVLYSRKQEGLQTFLYVRDMNDLKADYGSSFVEHLNRFERVSA